MSDSHSSSVPAPSSRRISVVLTALIVLSAPLVLYPLLRPSFAELDSVVKDCVETRPENRTSAQKENCKPRAFPFLMFF